MARVRLSDECRFRLRNGHHSNMKYHNISSNDNLFVLIISLLPFFLCPRSAPFHHSLVYMIVIRTCRCR
jgi:hypothetical protein